MKSDRRHISGAWGGRGAGKGLGRDYKGHRETFLRGEYVHYSIAAVVSWVCTYVKTYLSNGMLNMYSF